jgi:hypothetical protein
MSNAMKRAERYAAMLPAGAQYEIKGEDGIVSLMVRNSIEYLIVTVRDSRGTRTATRATGALFGRKDKSIPVRHIPWRLREWFVG